MTTISLREKKRLRAKLDLFQSLVKHAKKSEKQELFEQIGSIKEQLGIEAPKSPQKVKRTKKEYDLYEVVEDLNNGMSQSDVAKKHDLSVAYVNRIKNRHIQINYKVSDSYERLTPHALADLLNKGYTIVRIAEMYGMTRRGVGMMKSKYLEREICMKEGSAN